MKRREARLVPIAEFRDRSPAEEAWALLEDAGIPASVVGEPAMFGSFPVIRVFVASIHVTRAQQLVASIVTRAKP